MTARPGSNEATAVYAVASASKSDEGAYVCEATNEAGSREEMVQVSQSRAGTYCGLPERNRSVLVQRLLVFVPACRLFSLD